MITNTLKMASATYKMTEMSRTAHLVVPDRMKNAPPEAIEAVNGQGNNGMYPGVDLWSIEEIIIAAGTTLLQFDYRPEALIKKEIRVCAVYFTTQQTLEQCMTHDDHIDATKFAAMLQVAPFRAPGETISTYSSNVVVYKVTKPFYAARSTAHSNVHLGKGGATQISVDFSREEVSNYLKVSKIIPAANRETQNPVIQKMDAAAANMSVVARGGKKLFNNTVHDLSIQSPVMHAMLQGSSDKSFCIKQQSQTQNQETQ